MRGVSEVIAIILILMITISIAGLAYTFMSATMSSTTSAASSAVTTTTSNMLTSFTIESIDVSKVYIRNTGQSTITGLSVYVNDAPAHYNIIPAAITPGQTGSVTIYDFIDNGDTIKIASRSGFSASKNAQDPCAKAIGCWKFDEGSGTVVYDSSPYGNNGNINGAVFFRPYNDMSITSNEEGPSPSVIYDDDEPFWSITNEGSGSISAALSEDTSIKIKGSSSAKVTIGAGSTSFWGLYHDFSPSQDWSSYDFLSLWIYGTNSGTIYVDVSTTPWSHSFRYTISNNFNGWRRFILPFNSGLWGVTGSPTFSSVSRISIGRSTTLTTGPYYFDRTIVDVGNWNHGEAMYFDGVNDYIQVSSSPSLNETTTQFTVSLLAYPTTSARIIPFSDNAFYYNFYESGSNCGISINIGGTQRYPSFGVVSQNEWTFLSLVFDGSSIRTYKNGNLVENMATSGSAPPSGIIDIGNFQGYAYYFKGMLDEVRIYNRAIY